MTEAQHAKFVRFVINHATTRDLTANELVRAIGTILSSLINATAPNDPDEQHAMAQRFAQQLFEIHPPQARH